MHHWSRWAVAFAASLTTGCAAAQTAGSLRIVPTADASVTALDNSLLGGTDMLTVLRPGIQVNSQSSRLRARLDYSLSALHHSRPGPNLNLNPNPYPDQPDQANSLQNALNATLNADFFERWLSLDARTRISQQAISAYGEQTIDASAYNPNRTEVTDFSFKPSVQGRLADIAVYQFSLDAEATHTRREAAAGSRTSGASFSLSSASSASRWGVSGLVSTLRTAYSGGASSADDTRVLLSLLARPDVDLSWSVRGGQEMTAVLSGQRQRYNDWGGDLRWTPSVRTSAQLALDQRYFGRSQQISFEHRTPSSSLRFTSKRDAVNNAGANGVGQPVTLYDLFYTQFASLQPDPALRDQLVRDYLQSIQQDPNAQVSGGFLNGGTTLQRRDDLGFGYAGRRTTLTVLATSSQSRRIDANASSQQQEPVRQIGLNTALTYRLTPSSNLSLSASHLRAISSATQQGNQLSTAALAWSQQLGRSVSTSLAARYATFRSPINPYHETALTATLGLRY